LKLKDVGDVDLVTITSTIGSLGFGALIGVLLNRWLNTRDEQRKGDQERYGLLRLVHGEMQQNLVQIEQLNSGSVLMGQGAITLRTETWQAARVKLAEGPPGEDFGTIFEYYALVQDCIDNLKIMIRYWSNSQRLLDELQAFREGYEPESDSKAWKSQEEETKSDSMAWKGWEPQEEKRKDPEEINRSLSLQHLDAILRRIPAKSVAAEKVVQEYLNREGSLARRR
jgi:hypothetical protein